MSGERIVFVSRWGEQDLLEERARAIVRTGERLDRILAELKELERDLDHVELHLRGPDLSDEIQSDLQTQQDSLLEAHAHLHEVAVGALRQLIHQRESCGFRGHEVLQRCYPLSDVLLSEAVLEWMEPKENC